MLAQMFTIPLSENGMCLQAGKYLELKEASRQAIGPAM